MTAGATTASARIADPELDLANNEMPFRPLPGVRAALEAEIDRVARYPDPLSEGLCAAAAAVIGVPATNVIAGHGSSGALVSVLRFAWRPGATVVFATPSFTGYDALVRAAGAVPLPVPGDRDDWQPLAAMSGAVRDDTVAIVLTSPHNPSGAVVRAGELATFLRTVPASVLVVLDEAYLHFDEEYEAAEILWMIAAHPNLVVVRSFSKAHGLAALRVGYAVGNPAFMRRLRPARVAYDVGSLASAAAIASLRHRRELPGRVARVRAARHLLTAAARAHGFEVPTSYGNFVWLPTAATAPLVAAFAADGVAVREYPGTGIRITATTVRAATAVSAVLDRIAAIDGRPV